jgi:hypothetical protein
MASFVRRLNLGLLAVVAASSATLTGQSLKPYSVVNTVQFMGTGGIDYVFADSEARRLYVPRGNNLLVFDLDTLKSAGEIPDTGGRGVAVDPASHHGFSSSNPVSMFDTRTLQVLKKIEVQGGPDGILFEPYSRHVFVFSHRQPNATILDPMDGSIVGTLDLDGAPEQAASDGAGHLYVDIEDKDKVAVVDVKTLKVTAQYGLEGKGGTPAGLGLDAKNGILFVMCRNPANCVVLSASDGKILATLPIGKGSDGGGFNPVTMEAFSSQGDGTLTIIHETNPTTFEVTQTVTTKSRAKTCTLDTKKNQIVLITTEPAPPPAGSPPEAVPAAPGGPGGPDGQRRGGGRGGPGFLDILVVGR